MSARFFPKGVFFKASEVPEILENIESAAGDDLKCLQKKLSEFSPSDIETLNDGLLSQAKTSKLISLIVVSMKSPHEFSDELIVSLMRTAAKYAARKILTPLEFEEISARLIMGREVNDNSHSVADIVNAVLLESLGTIGGMKTLGRAKFDALDKMIVDDIRRESSRFNLVRSPNVVINLALLTQMAGSLKALLGSPQYKNCVTSSFVIERVYNLDKLTPEYIAAIAQVVDIDVFCNVCREASEKTVAINSAQNFAEAFGEESLLPRSSYKQMSGMIYYKQFPNQLNMIGHDDFDESKFPMFTEFLFKNLPAVYKLVPLDTDKLNVRYGLLALASRNGKVEEVLNAEADSWRDYLRGRGNVVDDLSNGQVLDRLRISAPFKFNVAMQSIGTVGLAQSESILKDANAQTLKELVDVHNPEPEEEKALMKQYPQLRGAMLDDALGL
jgi:hypothetical protein